MGLALLGTLLSIQAFILYKLAICQQLYINSNRLTNNMDAFQLDKEFQVNQNQEDSYYHQYCRLLLANIALTSQMKELIEEKKQLASRLRQYEDEDYCSQNEKMSDRNKRMRRNADQIQSCGKSYGSEGSLNQHYKLKHPKIYEKLPSAQSTLTLKQYQINEDQEEKQNFHKNINQKHR